MLTRILWVGLVAGIVAGLATAAVQHFTTTPLILKAEVFEKNSEQGVKAQSSAYQGETVFTDARLILSQGGATDTAEAETEEWAPDAGLERTFFTGLATTVTTIGYALMLLAAMIIGSATITPRTGLAWGIAAFVAVGMAPALGLGPELPGAAAADLTARQFWWGATVLASAAGLWLMLVVSSAAAIVAGIALLVAPHIFGAPHPAELTSQVPAELSAQFASSSLVVQALAWALAGVMTGYLWHRDTTRIAA